MFYWIVTDILHFNSSFPLSDLPGIQDGGILLEGDRETSILNIEAIAHAELRLRWQPYP